MVWMICGQYGNDVGVGPWRKVEAMGRRVGSGDRLTLVFTERARTREMLDMAVLVSGTAVNKRKMGQWEMVEWVESRSSRLDCDF
jgi:hypothetical protein